MALPETIQGLYDDVVIQAGMQLGSQISHIMEYYDNLGWINQCSSVVFTSNYCQYKNLMGGSDGAEVNGIWLGTIGTCWHPEIGENIAMMLCVGNSDFAGWNNTASYTYQMDYQTNIDGVTGGGSQQGSALNAIRTLRPVIDGMNRENYFIVPRITARNEQGQTWSGYLKEYRAVRDDYPFITACSAEYYYKADLTQNATTRVYFTRLGIRMPEMSWMSRKLLFSPQMSGSPHYRFTYGGWMMLTPVGPTIYSAPNFTHRWVQNYGYSSALNSANNTHVINGLYPGNHESDIYPFAYTELEQLELMINCMGFWWGENLTEVQQNAKGAQTTSPYIHVPAVTSEGGTTEMDWSGTSISEHWEDTGDGYRPAGGISIVYNYNINNNTTNNQQDSSDDNDPLDDSDQPLEPGNSSLTGVGCFSTYYAMSYSDIATFNDYLWSADETTLDALIDGLKFWGQDPMQAIMSLRLYPFNVASAMALNGRTWVKLGRVQTTAQGYMISRNASCILDLGQIYINADKMSIPKDFRQFSPFTTMELYIPFIGIVPISVNEFMNHLLRVTMIVDITTGTCEACIYSNERPMYYHSGVIGVEIPVTLNSMTQQSSAIVQGIMSAGIGAAAGLDQNGGWSKMLSPGENIKNNISAGIEGMGAGTAINMFNSAFEIGAGASNTGRRGASTAGTSLNMPLYCFLIVSTPTWVTPTDYNHTYGKPCHISDRISNFKGFSVFANVDTSGVNCTEMERNILLKLLEGGVYL